MCDKIWCNVIAVRCIKSNIVYVKCPKILYNKVSDKIAFANSADPDQTAQKETV